MVGDHVWHCDPDEEVMDIDATTSNCRILHNFYRHTSEDGGALLTNID